MQCAVEAGTADSCWECACPECTGLRRDFRRDNPSESERLRRVQEGEQAANYYEIWEGTVPAQDNRDSYTGS